MKVVANNSLITVQQIQFELSKAYLLRALRCRDFDNDSIYCRENVYLAVLYHTSGQNQTAIHHCILVIRSQDHSQCSSNVVQRDLLPNIDSHIDTALGLVVFCQYIGTAALNQHVVVFTRNNIVKKLKLFKTSFKNDPACITTVKPQITKRVILLSSTNSLYADK